MSIPNNGGLQGYSTPSVKDVVFAVDAGMEEYTRRVLARYDTDLLADRVRAGGYEGTGKYRGGDAETCWIIPLSLWMHIYPSLLAIAVQNQESILVLGELESQNRREARLFFLGAKRQWEDIGTWYEVTKEEAEDSEGYTLLNGHYFTTADNPPDCEEERKERETAQLIADLRMLVIDAAILHGPSGPDTANNSLLGRWLYAEDNPVKRAFDWLDGKTLVNGRTISGHGAIASAAGLRREPKK